MYPQQYFSLFPAAPLEPTVFVAMPFDDRLEPRWKTVISPAIEAINLEPKRVDARVVSESVLTEILQGITSAKLIFADVSSLDGHRNPNVMYELGIAHAVRQPTEVVVFRDDDSVLPFDVANARVNRYEPNPEADQNGARAHVVEALQDAVKEIDLTRSMAVELAQTRLDQTSFNLLISAMLMKSTGGLMKHPEVRTMGQVLASSDTVRSVAVLLEQRLLQPAYPNIYSMTKEFLNGDKRDEPAKFPVDYEVTALGEAVLMRIMLDHGGEEMVKDTELARQLERLVKGDSIDVT